MKASKITAIDFFDDLSSPYARKRFLFALFIFFLFFLVLFYILKKYIPQGIFHEISQSILIELISGIIIINLFYICYHYFIGTNDAIREVSAVRPQDIGSFIKKIPEDTRSYTFWGRSGSYFRSNTLIKIDEQSREKKCFTRVNVILPDPKNKELSNSYEEILKSLGEYSDENSLLENVLATSIICAIINENNLHMQIKIHYSNFLPSFRLDMSDTGAILTQDDKNKSALYFNSGSDFYEMFRTTANNEMQISKEIRWDSTIFKDLKIAKESCDKKTLNAFGFENENIDHLQQSVAAKIVNKSHRYQ